MRLEKLHRLIFGNDKDSSLEYQLMLVASVIGMGFAALSTLINSLLNFGVYTIIIPVVTAIMTGGLFYISKYRNQHKLAAYIAIILLTLVFYPVLWFTNGGSKGGVIYFFLFNSAFIAILFSRSNYRIMLFFQMTVVFLLLYIEYLNPSLVVVYKTEETRYIDQGVSFLIVFLFLFFIIRWVVLVHNQRVEEIREMNSELNNAHEELKKSSTIDSLSGLYNRKFILEKLKEEISNRDNRLSIFMLDIDHFKKVNDTYGHGAGDEVIRKIGEVLMHNIRKSDYAGRIGGEEFLIIFPGMISSDAERKANDIREHISQIKWDHMDKNITISGGVYYCGKECIDVDTALENVDRFLYEAKHKGRNIIVM